MAINAMGGAMSAVQQAAPQVKMKSDMDKDNDASKAGEVESAEKQQPPLPKPTATMGNNVNLYA